MSEQVPVAMRTETVKLANGGELDVKRLRRSRIAAVTELVQKEGSAGYAARIQEAYFRLAVVGGRGLTLPDTGADVEVKLSRDKRLGDEACSVEVYDAVTEPSDLVKVMRIACECVRDCEELVRCPHCKEEFASDDAERVKAVAKLKAAAGWVFACRQRAARELDSSLPPIGNGTDDFEACRACGGSDAAKEGCETCKGDGATLKPDPRQEHATWMLELREFLAGYMGMERHGVEGYMLLEGIEEVDARFLWASEIFRHELEDLEHAEDVRRAERTRERKGS